MRSGRTWWERSTKLALALAAAGLALAVAAAGLVLAGNAGEGAAAESAPATPSTPPLPFPTQPAHLAPDARGSLAGKVPWGAYAGAKPIARQLWFSAQRLGPAFDLGLFPWSESLEGERLRAGVNPPPGYAPLLPLDAELAAASRAAAALPLRASLEPWQSIGPTNIAGRMPAIAIDPTDPLHLYAGGTVAGVWESHDAGTSWTPLTDDLESLASGALAIDPTDPQVLYYATGEAQLSWSSYNGRGLFKSTDGGAGWTHLGLEFVPRFAQLVVDPVDPQVVWAAAYDNGSLRGVLRSLDGGASWASSLAVTDVTALVMDPAAHEVLYAAVGSVWGSADNGIYKTTDRGVSWTRLEGGLPPAAELGRISLAITPADGQTLYAGLSSDFAGSSGGQIDIYKTTDGGASWTPLGAPAINLNWYMNVLAVDPFDPQTVLAGGFDVWRSTDAGASWTNVGSGSVHVDIHQLVFSALAPGVVYAGCDGGIWLSVDAGATWMARNQGLVTVQYYGIAIDPTRELYTYGGTQDNWMHRAVGSTVWTYLFPPGCGDVDWIRVDPLQPSRIYATTCALWGIGRSTNEGDNWVNIKNGIGNEGANWIPPIDLDPADPSVLYVGTDRVYKTTNHGDLWVDKSGPLPGVMTALAVSPASSAVVWAGTDARRYRSTDAGETWAYAQGGTPFRYTTDIVPSFSEPLTALLSISGYGTGHVFRTTNAGGSWTDASGDLPDVPVNALAILPWDASSWIAGTDAGVFATGDGGASWQALAAGLPNVVVSDLWVHPATGLVRAGTMGRGAWEVSPGVPVPVADPDSIDFGVVALDVLWNTPLALSNSGSGPLRVAALEIDGPDAASFSVFPGGEGFVLLPGDQAARQVRFIAHRSGLHMATLHLVNAAAGGPELWIPLRGTGAGTVAIGGESGGDGAGGGSAEGGEGGAPGAGARRLGAPQPNPAPGRVAFTVSGAPGPVRLTIYNAAGQRIRTLERRLAGGGAVTLVWDGLAARGAPAPSGTYFARLEGTAGRETRKLLLVR